MRRDRRTRTGVLTAAAVALASGPAALAQPLTESRTLLVFNSADAESLAVRDMYRTAHPGVLEFDLADPSLTSADPAERGEITRAEFRAKVRDPLRAYLAQRDETGTTLAQRVIAIATTRGLPARIAGEDEFTLHSTWASLESELALLQQDLSGAALPAPFHTAVAGIIGNPYHGWVGAPIASFDRSTITTPRAFELVEGAAVRGPALTPGDLYLVTRVDSAPSPGRSALRNIADLLRRSQSLRLTPGRAQAVLDEWAPGADALDDDGGLFFSTADDFDLAEVALRRAGVPVWHDRSFDFITGDRLDTRPVILLATYGENHDARGLGADPPGVGSYLATFPRLHPAAVFVAYESFSGESIVTGASRGGQQQALDFIAAGGSFTVAHVAEPFSFAVADAELLARNFLLGGMTFAEAAYSAIPGLSWQNTPVGDPLARVTLDSPTVVGDLTGDGAVNGADLSAVLNAWGAEGPAQPADLNGDGVVSGADITFVLSNWTG